MNGSGAGQPGRTGSAARREKIAAARAAEAARARRRQRMIIGAVVAAVLVLAGVIGFAVQSTRSPSKPVVVPAHATGIDNGIVVGRADAPVTVDFYEDFQCPNCGLLEQTTGATVNALLDQGKIKAVYHMMSFLGPESVRAANASAAAAQAGSFKQFHDLLYANQPREHTGGFTDDTLIALGRQAGLTSTDFASAVRNGTYEGYVARVEDDASKRGVTATPTVFVNRRELSSQELSPSGFTAAVNAATGTPPATK
jgi:protein-disulfide isomerase